MTRKCNSEQRQTLRHVCFTKSQHLLILGASGTGKTFLLRAALKIYSILNIKTHVGSFTGLAAKNASGQTLHSLFPLHAVDNIVNWSPNKNLLDYHIMFQGIEGILFIDEISMVSARVLEQIMWLQKGKKCKYIFVGDLLQLPPIPHVQLDPTPKYIIQSPYIQNFKIHQLKVPQRQTQQDFLDIIQDIAYNFFQNRRVQSFLHSRRVAYDRLSLIEKQNLVHLFHDRSRVNQTNKTIFDQIPNPSHAFHFEFGGLWKQRKLLGGTIRETPLIQNWNELSSAHKVRYINLCEQHQIQNIELKMGCWVMFTRNLYNVYHTCKLGKDCSQHLQVVPIRNGTRAVVGDISTATQTIWIQLEATDHMIQLTKQFIPLIVSQKNSIKCKPGRWVRIKDKCAQIQQEYPPGGDLLLVSQHDRSFVIPKKDVTFIPELKTRYYLVSCFPIVLSYALTICKAQGMTLDRIVLHLYNVPTPNLIYVAISRCRTKEGVFINGNFTKPRQDVDPLLIQFYKSIA
jgi:hypothetical protein